MVWKAKASHIDGSVELVEVVEAFPDLKIHSSDSSFEVVYDLRKSPNHPAEGRNVRFSKQNEFFPVMSRDEISPSERESLWFRKAELKRMRKREEDRELDDGYEPVIENDPPQNDELQEALHQVMAVSVVLEEQSRQRKEHVYDPELISQKYKIFVERSRRSMFIANLARMEKKKKCHVRPLQIIPDHAVFADVDTL